MPLCQQRKAKRPGEGIARLRRNHQRREPDSAPDKESATNKEKLGAEFPFTRYFYECKEPEEADDLLAQFMELEKSLSEKFAAFRKARGHSVRANK